ncbi:Acetylcholinesterase [Trichoplax sp. H2]|nr:Acetylcholinesterase [Trichoplax sp. H2]|eukprot:RDD37480.1 Acetylcholinesterase [Trichoplax sp. H2]
MVNIAILVASLLLCQASAIASAAEMVHTNKGPVAGIDFNVEGKTVYGYLGIPFAQPPVGPLRFQPPQPIETAWKQPFDATSLPYACPQSLPIPDLSQDTKHGQIREDCLYINVWTPSASSTSKLPVFVFIHGGAYFYGSGSRWQGKVLASNQNIIVVTMNYRLGAFGFMTPGEKVDGKHVIEPNLGLYDQRLALQWVRENIAQFGGDPNKITASGNSVGAMSVGLHTMSPGSKGLIHGAILDSGTPQFPEFFHPDFTTPRKVFEEAVKHSNCARANTAETVACLQDLPMQELLGAQFKTMGVYPFGFSVVVDGQFLPDNPETLLKNGQYEKVPTMIGTTSDDGSVFVRMGGYPDIEKGLSTENFFSSIDVFFKAFSKQTRSAIKFRYTNWVKENDPLAVRDEATKLFNDYFFAAPADKCAQQYASDGVPTYYFEFAFPTKLSFIFPSYLGVTHTMEMPQVVGYPIDKPASFLANFTDEDVKVSRRMMETWGNFIKYGTPTTDASPIQWPRYDKQYQTYAKLDDKLTIGQHYLGNRVAFWNKYIPELEDYAKKCDSLALTASTKSHCDRDQQQCSRID